MTLFYSPTSEQIERLSGPWCASYSGGKDSTSVVTLAEWLRRTKQIPAGRPQLVQSDTMVEYPALQENSRRMMDVLRKSGWECAVVTPPVNQKLYCRILGVGLTPVHPGGRKMRWCTRATKIDPMKRWRAKNSSGITLTGLRLGESAMRDGKIIKAMGCSSGGECGIPDPSDDTYSPILNWTTCKVVDWLMGWVSKEVKEVMADILPITRELMDIYEIKLGEKPFGDWASQEVTAARFGCIGCPAIEESSTAPASVIARHGAASPLNELYAVWHEARLRRHRLHRADKAGAGPIKMASRKLFFERVMDIQHRAGVVLVTAEDEVFIRECWENQVYPQGWSAADELTNDAIAAQRHEPLLNLTIDGVPV